MDNHADERDWAAVTECIYLVGGSAASAKIWILRMQWKIQLKIKRPCKLKSQLFVEYRLAFGNLYMLILQNLVDLNE